MKLNRLAKHRSFMGWHFLHIQFRWSRDTQKLGIQRWLRLVGQPRPVLKWCLANY